MAGLIFSRVKCSSVFTGSILASEIVPISVDIFSKTAGTITSSIPWVKLVVIGSILSLLPTSILLI